MVKFVIEVINVSAPKFTKTAGGGYNSIDVAYKRDGKTDGKKLVDFDAKGQPGGKAVYDLLSQAKEGQSFEIEAIKGEKFWNWVSAQSASGSGESGSKTESDTKSTDSNSVGESGSKSSGSTRGRVAGSNYETPEERALRREADRVRQYYIVRQSSISSALEYLKSATGEVEDSVESVIEVAKKFETYVFGPVPSKDEIPF